MKRRDPQDMVLSHCTETAAGIYRHLTVRGQRYPVAVIKRGDIVFPLRDAQGQLLYATPGGGRATAHELIAAASTVH